MISHKDLLRGFSLTEMLVVIAILGTVGITLGSAIQYFYQSNAYLFEAAVALENAQRGLNTSLRHIREAVSGEDGSYPLASVATSSVTFHADVDFDNAVERVRYFMQGGTLYESVTNAAGNPPSYTGQAAATTTVIQYVRNGTSTPIFRFYDENGAELSAPFDVGAIQSIGITIQTDLNPQRLPNVYTLSGNASIRNIINQ
jgi:prepilin-type N-terminal cleavage/methylation domain-containing protein